MKNKIPLHHSIKRRPLELPVSGCHPEMGNLA